MSGDKAGTPIPTNATINESAVISPTRISFSRATARPFGVHFPTAAIHAGIVSKGKKEPPIISKGNMTTVVNRFAGRSLEIG